VRHRWVALVLMVPCTRPRTSTCGVSHCGRVTTKEVRRIASPFDAREGSIGQPPVGPLRNPALAGCSGSDRIRYTGLPGVHVNYAIIADSVHSLPGVHVDEWAFHSLILARLTERSAGIEALATRLRPGKLIPGLTVQRRTSFSRLPIRLGEVPDRFVPHTATLDRRGGSLPGWRVV
jgi:hypothetical protein